MKKLFSFFLLLVTMTGGAQLKSPDQFLGYQLGTRYTPHYRIVQYFQYVAQTKPDMVKLQQYGETNEHRPLYVAFVASSENMANLEQIRKNNLAMAHQGEGQPAADAPAVVWLSYNVHGNETSSSEAAMKTLFFLTDPANSESKQWLKNTVVVIDPCLNPDGRDRYVNWYNTMIGKHWNPLTIAREHREEWPGGRSNHYNYDLNRDWVWQTQVESRGRVAVYNQWLPQVHVDFHEQSVNAPYYFAPAAEPYHEVITQWQRDFQKTIGKNNAKYFDKNGWLFFTAQRFDLFYPSYGDTYPLYNGSIGMTYEQGGISAGLGILTNDKDTLSLVDRVQHHFTTGISTVEISSKNAGDLVKNFRQYFDNAVNGKVGEYKTYVIKNNPEDGQRISALVQLLDRNGIKYGTASGAAKGFSYISGKEESFSVSSSDLVISGIQPKATLVKVLFEPQSKLSDSVTYDITAWALPYAYGLTAYATKQSFTVTPSGVWNQFSPNSTSDSYAYAIKWQGLNSVRAVGEMLQKGIRIRFTEDPLESGGEKFDRGTILINKAGNGKWGSNLWATVAEVCNRHQVKMYPISSGMADKGPDFGSDMVHVLRAPRVAMLTGEGVFSNAAGEVWDYFDNQIGYPITLVNAKDFGRMQLSEWDVIILPSGMNRFLSDKESAAALAEWIGGGGRLIGIGNVVAQLSKQEWSAVKMKGDGDKKGEEEKGAPYDALKTYSERERDDVSEGIPGAIYKVDVDNTHPLMFGYPNYYYTLKLDPTVYEFSKGGWNVGYLKKDNYVAGYVGSKLTSKLQDGLLFGVQDMGRGSVVYLTDDIIFRNFWETGKLMLANAVFLVGQ
ncbi:MAG: M14 family metallopeptidase [Chitinophagaceae bacterium]|nr:M14 family metallopeptidase [Chitinophagaceae bacterium]